MAAGETKVSLMNHISSAPDTAKIYVVLPDGSYGYVYKSELVGSAQNNIPKPFTVTLSELGAASFQDAVPTKLAAWIVAQGITITEIEIPIFEVTDGVSLSQKYICKRGKGSLNDVTAADLFLLVGTPTLQEVLAAGYESTNDIYLLDGAGLNATGSISSYSFALKDIVTSDIIEIQALPLTTTRSQRLQDKDGTFDYIPEVKTANFSAENETRYTANGTLTVTDPTPVTNKGYIVHVIGGTATIGGVGYTAGSLVYRYYNGTAWVSDNYVTKDYIDTEINDAVAGMLDDRGNYDASSNTFPSSGGSGTAGAILKGDLWTISVSGTLGGIPVTVGDVVRALVDSPGTTASNWVVTENNIGYVPENNANKTGTVSGNETSTTLFPNLNGITSWIKNNLLGWVGAHGTAIVDADTIPIGKSGVLGTRTWAQIKATLASTFFLDATSSIQGQLDGVPKQNDLFFIEDFLSANNLYTTFVLNSAIKINHNSTGSVGNTTNIPPVYDNKNQGVVYMRPNASSNFYMGAISDDKIKIGQGEIIMDEFILVEDITSGSGYCNWFGLLSSVAGVNTNGIFFALEYGTNSGFHSTPSSNWKCITASSVTGLSTVVDSGIAASTSSWVRLTIMINATGTAVTFYINGSPVGAPISTNIPTARMFFGHNCLNRSSASHGFWIDYMKFWYKGIR